MKPLSEDETAMLLNMCGVGGRYLDVTLAHDNLNKTAHKTMVQRYLKEFPKHLSDGLGLYIHGDYGVGKTSLAVILMREALVREGKPYIVRASDIPRIIIEKTEVPYLWELGPCSEREILQHCDLLVIDNLNEELSGKWQSTALEDLIRDRYENKRVTVVTSNLPPAKLSTLISAGCASLMGDMMVPLEVKGVTWRTKKSL